MTLLLSIIKLCRPSQWIKNLFIYLPLFFSGNILNLKLFYHCSLAFAAFCLASSAIYCLNDLMDADYDRLHPIKRLRPVASGEVGRSLCILITIILSFGALAIPLFLLKEEASLYSLLMVGAYIILNIGYCLKLKQEAIIDVVIISLGFVLRVGIGGTSTGISLSPWIIIMTFLLALFLALSKRRNDILIFESTGKQMRKNIEKYNLDFLNQATTMVGTVMLVSYIIYTVSPDVIERFHSDYVFATSIFVLLGLLRYMQLALVFSKTGSPTKVLLKDRFIQICIAGWILLFFLIIYC